MILTDFLKDSQFWLEKERDNVTKTAGNIPSILLDIFGSTATSFGEVVVERQSSFDLLNASKLEVLSELNSDPGHIVSLITSRQADLIDGIVADAGKLQTCMTDLTEGVNKQPTRVTDKTSIRQVIEDVQQVLNQTKDAQGPSGLAGDPLQSLVTDGIISQTELDDYLSKNPYERRKTTLKTIQVVREVRDRYYKIDPSDQRRLVVDDNTIGIDIVDEDDNPVEEVFGYPDVRLTPDGEISLTGENGTQETLYLRPKSQKRKPSNNPRRKRKVFDNQQDKVKEEFAYESWACALFKLVDQVQSLVESLENKLSDLVAVANISNRLLNQTPLGSAFDFTAGVMGDLYALGDMDEIEIGDRVLEFVGLSQSFSLGGVSPGASTTRAVCETNKRLFCQATFGYDRVFKLLSSQLDALDLSFGFDLGELDPRIFEAFEAIANITAELQGYVDDLRDLTRKLFGDICAFISRGIRGTPKSANEINEKVGLILALAALAPGAIITGVNNSVRLVKIIARLSRAGYDAASRALANGDISGFLAMKNDDATHAGRSAICLEQAANDTDNLSLSNKMARLAAVSRTRANRQTTSQRINEGMHRRFVQRDVGVQVATIVRDEGAKGITEVSID